MIPKQLVSKLFNTTNDMFFSYTPRSQRKGNIFFITITTRKKYKTDQEFKIDLLDALTNAKYPSQVYGYIEKGDTIGYHFHGFSHHKYKHFKKTDNHHICVKDITTESSFNTVMRYIVKGINGE